MISAKIINEQRATFPRGLQQPAKGYRFSLDSLLLASFAQLPNKAKVLDLGTGCGVVTFALLLANQGKSLCCTGIDLQPEMIEAALANALALGLSKEVDFVLGDVLSYRGNENRIDVVLANPPYRVKGTGRASSKPSRETGRFEGQAGLAAFARAATYHLRDKARFFMVHLPERLAAVIKACQGATLEPKRVRFVHSRADEPARIMLFEARKNSSPGLTIEPPLFLYEGQGNDTRMTSAALALCPYLQCNAQLGEKP